MPSQLPIEPQHFASWSELKETLRQMDGWIFRGQRDSCWALITSIERAVSNPAERAEIEYDLTGRFISVVDNYLPGHRPFRRIELLAMMQHHGAPTRLLDWTRSPYVATYFGIEDAAAESDCVVWAIHRGWCLKSAGVALGGDPNDMATYFDKVIEWFPEMPPFDGVVIATSAYLSERQVIQQGLFLALGSLGFSFEENLQKMVKWEPLTETVKRFHIPGKWRREILRDLSLMNITRATLYPGLDGFAQSLKYECVWRPRK